MNDFIAGMIFVAASAVAHYVGHLETAATFSACLAALFIFKALGGFDVRENK